MEHKAISDEAIRAYYHAVIAAEWCRQLDKNGDTRFQRILRTVSAWCMERGRTAITASELRTRFHMSNNSTAAIMRWLVMADCSLCEYITTKHNEGLDEDPDALAQLFQGFGVKPTSANHAIARQRYRAMKKGARRGH